MFVLLPKTDRGVLGVVRSLRNAFPGEKKAEKKLKRRSGTASVKPEIKICVNRPIQAFFMFKRIKRAKEEKCRRRQNRQTQPTVESFF